MKRINYFDLSFIFSEAEKTLRAIETLPQILAEFKISIPTDFNETKKGGYLSLYQRNPFINSGELLLLGKIGEIDDEDDSTFGSKSEKYQKKSREKCRSLIHQANALTSDQTSFNIKGGITLNKSFILGFSGRSPLEDELLVVTTGIRCRYLFTQKNQMIDDGQFIDLEVMQRSNPFLMEEIINLIIKHS